MDSDSPPMMTEQPTHASAAPGAVPGEAMDRRMERRLTPWWRRRGVLIAFAILVAAVALWRFLPASGSTDIAAADIETSEVTRAPFEDYLPVRATVAPRVTTLVGVL